MNTPLITIIIPVYNVEQYLHRCVDSVLNQTYSNLKVILVDDGSPDNCPEICDEYEMKDKRVVVIHKENGGLSSARNAALDFEHGGEFLFFLDSDDFLHLRAIEILCAMQQDTGADMIQCQYIHGSNNEFPKIELHNLYNIYDNYSIFYSKEMTIRVWGSLYKTSIWDNIRAPEGYINEDDATSWQAYFQSSKIVFTQLPLYYYYENRESIMWQLKKNFKLDFIQHYHRRIDYFRNKGLNLHTQLSQWRFCLPLMMSSVRCSVATEHQLKIMRLEFLENVYGALSCDKVPILHKLLFLFFLLFPKTCRFLCSIIWKH